MESIEKEILSLNIFPGNSKSIKINEKPRSNAVKISFARKTGVLSVRDTKKIIRLISEKIEEQYETRKQVALLKNRLMDNLKS